MKSSKKSPYAATVYTSIEPVCDTYDMPGMLSVREAPGVDNLRDKIPAPAHKGFLATVKPTTTREHDPLPLLDKIEKIPAKGVSKHKKMAAGR